MTPRKRLAISLVISFSLMACSTPSQWCIGACTQTNPAKARQ